MKTSNIFSISFINLFSLCVCALLLVSSCHKSKPEEGLSSYNNLNKVPLGFKFPATYQGSPIFYGIQISERGLVRQGSSFDQKKYFPYLPFYNDFGRLLQGFIPDYTPKSDPFFENNIYSISLTNEEITEFGDKYKFWNNGLYYSINQSSEYHYWLAYGSYEKLYWYDHFVNINGNFLVIYRTSHIWNAEEVIDRLQAHFSEWLSPTGKNSVAIATYYTQLSLQK